MAGVNRLNFISVLERSLGKEIKEAITEALVRDELAEYEKKLRSMIKPKVESLVFTGIERLSDMASMRDEINVYIKWEGEEEGVTR